MKDLTFLTSSLIAHRGIHNDKIEENTLLAFKRAIKKRYIIEFDVHMLKDETLVVYHDYNLKKLTGVNEIIENLTYDELKKIKLKTGQMIPTLKEVLELIDGKVPIIIELKGKLKPGRFEELVAQSLDSYKGLFAIQSFNAYSLYWFKKNRPNYIKGQLVTLNYNYNLITNFIFKHMILNPIVKPDFIGCNVKRMVNQRIRNKYIILGWTIRTKEEYDKYKNECDNLIVDNLESIID